MGGVEWAAKSGGGRVCRFSQHVPFFGRDQSPQQISLRTHAPSSAPSTHSLRFRRSLDHTLRTSEIATEASGSPYQLPFRPRPGPGRTNPSLASPTHVCLPFHGFGLPLRSCAGKNSHPLQKKLRIPRSPRTLRHTLFLSGP
ncbi:hypothetical protein B0H12DRAFT_1107761 [Mycena haematopus]|nr:hypothetical protein B0H12DRAFT_1107761 [Mycena haematopus]